VGGRAGSVLDARVDQLPTAPTHQLRGIRRQHFLVNYYTRSCKQFDNEKQKRRRGIYAINNCSAGNIRHADDGVCDPNYSSNKSLSILTQTQ